MTQLYCNSIEKLHRRYSGLGGGGGRATYDQPQPPVKRPACFGATLLSPVFSAQTFNNNQPVSYQKNPVTSVPIPETTFGTLFGPRVVPLTGFHYSYIKRKSMKRTESEDQFNLFFFSIFKYANSTSVVSFHVFNINVSGWFLFSLQYHVAILTIIEKLPGIA